MNEDGVNESPLVFRWTNGPKGIGPALADVIIRAAEIAQHYRANLSAPPGQQVAPKPWAVTFGDWVTDLHQDIDMVMSGAAYAFVIGTDGMFNPRNNDWHFELHLLVAKVQLMAAHYAINLDAALAAKMEHNRADPPPTGNQDATKAQTPPMVEQQRAVPHWTNKEPEIP